MQAASGVAGRANVRLCHASSSYTIIRHIGLESEFSYKIIVSS